MKDFDKRMSRVGGNLKHEGMILTDYEKELIKKVDSQELTREEFIQEVIKFHKKELGGH